MSYQFVEDHRDYLLRELKFRMERRPLYSQRAFSRDLHVSPSTLSDFLKNRLALSPGRITLLSKKLGLNRDQKEHWVDLITYRFNKCVNKKKESLVKIKSRIHSEKNAVSLEEFKIISEWYHFAYLELIDMNSKKYTHLSIAAKALSVHLSDLKVAVARLQQLKLIKVDSNGLFQVETNTEVGHHTPSVAIRQFHTQILQKAITAIEIQPMTERYNTSTFIGISENQIPEIIEKLKSATSKIFEPYVVNSEQFEKHKLYCFSVGGGNKRGHLGR